MIMCKKCNIIKYIFMTLVLVAPLVIFILCGFGVDIDNSNILILTFLVCIFQLIYIIVFSNKEDKYKKGRGNLFFIIINAIFIIINGFITYCNYCSGLDIIFILINASSIIGLFIVYQIAKDSVFYVSKEKNGDFELKSLAPIESLGSNSIMVKSLANACQNTNNFNIAVDGIYGSGKSSIINTFVKTNNDSYSFLKVSFANFEDKGKKKNEIQNESCLEMVMNTIFEELLIHYTKKPNYFLSFVVSILLLSLLYFINIKLNFISENKEQALFFSIGISMVFILFTIIFSSIKRGKIGLGDYSLEIESRSDSIEARKLQLISLLKKYNNEVILVIEDLDRFKEIGIYSSFRELNFILNQRMPNRIIFLYALDTSIFNSAEERVKFFDAIIPVVPVVAKENISYELSGLFNGTIAPKLIDSCSLCIDNMRVINNLYNEFSITKQYFIEKNSSYYENKNDKIFAIVAFKNLFPSQFNELFKNNNYLDHILGGILNLGIKTNEGFSDFNDYMNSLVIKGYTNIKTIINNRNVSYNSVKELICQTIVQNLTTNDVWKLEMPEQNSRERLINFIIQMISFGYLGFDYIEYLSPVSFCPNDYDSQNDFNDDLREREMIVSNSSNNMDYIFKNPYFVCRTLHLKCFTYESIINFSLISTLFKNVVFSDKKSRFVESFLKNVVFTNLRLKKLIMRIIIEYDSDYHEIIDEVFSQSSFYLMFSQKDDVECLSKFIKIVYNDYDKNILIRNINSSSKLLKLIEDNIVSFVSHFDENMINFFIINLKNSSYKFTNSSKINKALVASNKFDSSLSSVKEWFAEKNIDLCKLENFINHLKEQGSQQTYASKISILINSIIASEDKFSEKMSIIQVLSSIISQESLQKLIKNNVDFIEHDVSIIENKNIIFFMVREELLPFSIKIFYDLLAKTSNEWTENMAKYVYLYINDIFINSECYINLTNNILNNLIVNYKLNSNVIKKMESKFDVLTFNRNDTSKENALMYALEYDKEFERIDFSIFMLCKNEGILDNLSKAIEEEKLYLLFTKKLNKANLTHGYYNTFINKCLPSYENKNGVLSKKNVVCSL